MDYQITLEIPRVLDDEEIAPALVDVWCDSGSMWRFTAVFIDGVAYENRDHIELLLKCLGGVKRITRMANKQAERTYIRLCDERANKGSSYSEQDVIDLRTQKLVGKIG